MEGALVRKMTEYSRYGTGIHKQVYIYGTLDTGPTVLHRGFGFAWAVGGWLLWPFLNKIALTAWSGLMIASYAEAVRANGGTA